MVAAVKLMLLPEQTGELLPTVGAAGVDGLDNTIGPATGADGHELLTNFAIILVYEPATNL